VAELERELGITPGLLWKWKQRKRVDSASPGGEPTTLEAAKAEIRRLKRELAVASQERDIPKKSHQRLLAGRRMKFTFVADQQGVFPISRM
jgi:transposase-like protein